MRKWIAGAAVAATIGGAGAGAALLNAPILATAQSTSSTASAGRTAPPWMTDALKKLVDAGTINQSQADAVSQALVAARPVGHGPRGHHRQGGKHLSAVAAAIGIDQATLRTELKAGKTIAQVAQERGVDVQKVVDALVADLKTRLDAKVAEGRITQAQADEKLAEAPARITDMVNKRPKDGARGPGGRAPARGGAEGMTPPTTTG